MSVKKVLIVLIMTIGLVGFADSYQELKEIKKELRQKKKKYRQLAKDYRSICTLSRLTAPGKETEIIYTPSEVAYKNTHPNTEATRAYKQLFWDIRNARENLNNTKYLCTEQYKKYSQNVYSELYMLVNNGRADRKVFEKDTAPDRRQLKRLSGLSYGGDKGGTKSFGGIRRRNNSFSYSYRSRSTSKRERSSLQHSAVYMRKKKQVDAKDEAFDKKYIKCYVRGGQIFDYSAGKISFKLFKRPRMTKIENAGRYVWVKRQDINSFGEQVNENYQNIYSDYVIAYRKLNILENSKSTKYRAITREFEIYRDYLITKMSDLKREIKELRLDIQDF